MLYLQWNDFYYQITFLRGYFVFWYFPLSSLINLFSTESLHFHLRIYLNKFIDTVATIFSHFLFLSSVLVFYIFLIFPDFSMVKNLPTNARDTGNLGLITDLKRSPVGWHGNPLQYSCLENPMGRGVWQAIARGMQKVRHDWSNLACTTSLYMKMFMKFLTYLDYLHVL